jgi:hypothetical protein
MPTTSTPAGFSLESLLTRVLPGFVFLLPILIEVYLVSGVKFGFSSINIVIFTIIAVIIGEFIDHWGSGLFRVPLPFRYTIYKSTGDVRHLPGWYRYVMSIDEWLPDRLSLVRDLDGQYSLEERLGFDFIRYIENELNLDTKTASARDLYDAVILYIDRDMSTRTKQYRTAYHFDLNFKISVFASALWYLYFASISYPDPIWVLYIIILFMTSAIALGLIMFLSASSNLYVEMLIKEIYIDQSSK